MWWWPDRGPRWTSWLSQPSCSFLQWGERLYRVKTPPLSARHGPPVLTSAPHVHPAAHSTPRRRDLTQTCYMLCALQRGRASFQCSDGENNQTHTHTHRSFSSPLFSLLSTASCRFLFTVMDVVIVVVFFCSHLQNQIRMSGHWMDSWSCVNVKAKQMCFCYLCL